MPRKEAITAEGICDMSCLAWTRVRSQSRNLRFRINLSKWRSVIRLASLSSPDCRSLRSSRTNTVAESISDWGTVGMAETNVMALSESGKSGTARPGTKDSKETVKEAAELPKVTQLGIGRPEEITFEDSREPSWLDLFNPQKSPLLSRQTNIKSCGSLGDLIVLGSIR